MIKEAETTTSTSCLAVTAVSSSIQVLLVWIYILRIQRPIMIIAHDPDKTLTYIVINWLQSHGSEDDGLRNFDLYL